MLCPTDGAALVMSGRSGIEMDYCHKPQHKEPWLSEMFD